MKLAAIDIGSNAIRFQVSSVLDQGPRILFKKLMKAYKLLIELYEVDDSMFCATSAMRESENGAQLVQEVYEEIGVTIHIIDGI